MRREEQNELTHPCLMTHPVCQQRLRACRPTLDQRPACPCFAIAIFHLLVGIVVIGLASTPTIYKERYDQLCGLSDDQLTGSATVRFDVKPSAGKWFLYYELHDFYQTHFRFGGSYSQSQLSGSYVQDRESCLPERTVLINGTKVTLAPCGLMATGFFTDYYEVVEGGRFSDVGIAWPREIGHTFKPVNRKYGRESRWMLDPDISDRFPGETVNEHFIVWMRSSNRPTFRKLWGRSSQEEQVVGPRVTVDVECRYGHNMFKGERWLVLVKPGRLGGKNIFVGCMNIGLFVLLTVFAMVFKWPAFGCRSERIRLYHDMRERGNPDDAEMVLETVTDTSSLPL